MSNSNNTVTALTSLGGPATTLTTVGPEQVQGLYLTVFSNYCSVGAFMLLLWDMTITMGDEIEFMWLQPGRRLGKILFFLNRYLPPLDIAILINTYVNPGVNRSLCLPWFSIDNWLSVFSLVVVEVVMLLRTYALWNCSKRILAFLVVVLTICTFVTCSAVLYFTLTAQSVGVVGGVRPCVNVFKELNVVQAVWGSTIVFDSTVVILMLVKIYPMIQEGSSTDLFQSMYEDGFMYFAVLFCASTANLFVFALAPNELKLMLVTLQRTLFSMLASRLVLNLRGVLLKRSLFTTLALESAVNRRACDVTLPSGPAATTNTQGTGASTFSTITYGGSSSKTLVLPSPASLSPPKSTKRGGFFEGRSKRDATTASVELGYKHSSGRTRQHTLSRASKSHRKPSDDGETVEMQAHTRTASRGTRDLFEFDDLTTLNFSDLQLAETYSYTQSLSRCQSRDDGEEQQSQHGTTRSPVWHGARTPSGFNGMRATAGLPTKSLDARSLDALWEAPSQHTKGDALGLEAGPSTLPAHSRSRRTLSI